MNSDLLRDLELQLMLPGLSNLATNLVASSGIQVDKSLSYITRMETILDVIRITSKACET